MRLNAFIAKAGICSRRKSAEHIKLGKVRVRGRVIREPWYIVQDGDDIVVNGVSLRQEKHAYFIVNKPRGVTSTVEDAHAAKKITDLVPKGQGRLYPIGRLDKDSSGLVILTNDGDLCYRLTHPKFEIEKEYIVTVRGSLDEKALAQVKKGVYSEGDVLKVKSFSNVEHKGATTALHVIIAEGKKRHIRRLFGGMDLKVLDLKRIRIGSIKLGELKEGNFQKVDKRRFDACLNRKAY